MSQAVEHASVPPAAQPREMHIPLRPADLVRKLGDEPAVTIFEREQFRQLCQLIEATIHHEYRTRLGKLKVAYAPFDPDDVAAPDSPNEAHRGHSSRDLFQEFDALLGRANYRRLDREELLAAIHSPWKKGSRLHVDLSIFECLEVYVRGDCQLARPLPGGWHKSVAGARGGTALVPGYRRLAIIFRLARQSPMTDPLDARVVVLKLFKDIPRHDTEMLLPGGMIRIGLLEQAQIVVPTISGLGLTLFKLLKGAAAVAFAGVYGLLGFLGLIIGAIGYGVRSFYGYWRTRERHQLCLTRHLYCQNLDNNAGVLYHLLAEAEEQEFREVALAWWLLWRGGLSGAAAEQIDRAAEGWLRERCGIEVDFEVSDALHKLERYGLARMTANGRWSAIPIEDALATLDDAWDKQFAYHRPSTASTRPARPRLWRDAA